MKRVLARRVCYDNAAQRAWWRGGALEGAMRKVRLVLLAAVVVLVPVLGSAQTLVRDVRAAIARNDIAAGR